MSKAATGLGEGLCLWLGVQALLPRRVFEATEQVLEGDLIEVLATGRSQCQEARRPGGDRGRNRGIEIGV